jgi:uncharacterized protein (DUF983 family)
MWRVRARRPLINLRSRSGAAGAKQRQILVNDKADGGLGRTILTGLRGRCPRCGEGALFAGFLSPAEKCRQCRLDYGFMDAGDGPAVFIIMFAGMAIAALALYTEIVYAPSYLVHALLWGPLAIVLPLALLRPFKGVLIALQYRNAALEGELDR